MKFIFVVNYLKWLFLGLLGYCLIGCTTTGKQNDDWFGEDKLKHFVVGGVIGAGVTKIAENNGVHECTAPAVGISVTLVVGAGKESYDKRIKGTAYSWKDMVWNLAGSTLGSLAVSNCQR